MLQIKALNGQSIFDLCLQTYGSFDYLRKLMDDNNVENIDTPIQGQSFTWDETLLPNITLQNDGAVLATYGLYKDFDGNDFDQLDFN